MWSEKVALDNWLILALIHLFYPQTTCCPCAARGQCFMIYMLSFIKGILICSCGILIYHWVTLCPCIFTRTNGFFLRMLLDFLRRLVSLPLIYFNRLADWNHSGRHQTKAMPGRPCGRGQDVATWAPGRNYQVCTRENFPSSCLTGTFASSFSSCGRSSSALFVPNSICDSDGARRSGTGHSWNAGIPRPDSGSLPAVSISIY